MSIVPPECMDCGAPCQVTLVCLPCMELRQMAGDDWFNQLLTQAESRWPDVDFRIQKVGRKRAPKWGQSTDLNAFNQEEAVA